MLTCIAFVAIAAVAGNALSYYRLAAIVEAAFNIGFVVFLMVAAGAFRQRHKRIAPLRPAAE